jgi:hypothetical protein
MQVNLNETVPIDAMTRTALEAGEGKSASVGLRQHVQQRLRLLQICRVEPFGEPTIDRGQ